MESIPSGYEVRKSATLPRLDGHFYDLVHTQTGARHIHLTVPDRNSYFCAMYRTLPNDSTGAPHIQEHMVSGGSRRFPPKAGGDMYTRSLVTDLNATTHGDFTNYYFASRNRTDFMNWMEYVTDISMYARMEESSFLRQRGRFQFNDPEDPKSGLKFIGIIFNEQKAAFGVASNHAFRTLNQALFPGHPYSHSAGGDSRDVPKLTYEEIMEFNRRFYHPANAFFLSRGNVPVSEILPAVEKIVGDDFPRREDVEIPPIPQIDGPVVAEGIFPVGRDDTTAGEMALGWVTIPSADSYQRILMQVAISTLMEGPGAPLRRAIEDSGLVDGLINYRVGSQLRATVAMHLTGVNPGNVAKVESLVLETLKEAAGKGLDAMTIDAVITRLELRHREQRGALRVFLDSVVPPAIYGGDPFPALELDSDLERLVRERQNGRPFEDLILDQLVENHHRALVTMRPDPDFEQRVRDNEAKWLAEVEAGLSDADRKAIFDYPKKQASAAPEEFPKRGLTPLEGFAELSEPEVRTEDVAGVPVELFEAATGGVNYLSVRINASGLDDELVDYLGLFASVVARKARGAASSAELIGVANHLRVDARADNTLHWLELNARALDRDQSELPELIAEILTSLEFDPKMLRQLVSESHSRLQQGLMGEAQVHLRRLAGAALRRSSHLDDRIRGIGQLTFLKNLSEKPASEDAAIVNRLGQIRDQLIVRSRLAVCLVGASPDAITSLLGDALGKFAEGSAPAPVSQDTLSAAKPHRARVTQLPVAFTCEAHSIPGLSHADGPAIAVLGHVLWSGYLTAQAGRVGAYGLDVETLPERGLFWMSSRRDPLPAQTYKAMTEGIARFREGRWEGPKAEEGRLAALRVSDPVDSSASAARRAWVGRFTGHTVEAWNKFRRGILEVTDANLQTVAQQHLTEGARATLSGPNMLEENRDEVGIFDEVVHV